MTLRILALFALLLAFGLVGKQDYDHAVWMEKVGRDHQGWTRECALDVKSHWLRCEHYDATGRLRVTADMCC